MTKELIYSSDKERLLDELSKAGVTSSRLPALNGSDLEALKTLLDQVKGVPKEGAVPEKPRSPRMTHQDLKAMKTVTQKADEPMVPVFRKVSQLMAKLTELLKVAFSPR